MVVVEGGEEEGMQKNRLIFSEEGEESQLSGEGEEGEGRSSRNHSGGGTRSSMGGSC